MGRESMEEEIVSEFRLILPKFVDVLKLLQESDSEEKDVIRMVTVTS